MRHRSFGGRRKPSSFRKRGKSSSQKASKHFNIKVLIDNQSMKAPKPVQKYTNKHIFDDFELDAKIKLNVAAKGYAIPTPIQDQAIVPALQGKDLIGVANTGTGKTAAFLLPMLNKVLRDPNQKVLILAPTRELALQIFEEFKSFAQRTAINATLCIGGASINTQIFNLKKNHNFVIGTPGRVKDLSQRKLIRFGQFDNVILDEVDQMMDMGFIHEIRKILSELPKQRQSLFFSATIPKTVLELINQFMINPIQITVKTGDTAANVYQELIRVSGNNEKNQTLSLLLSKKEFDKVLIFGRTKHGVDRLCRSLVESGFSADSIHGNKTQSRRQKALDRFKKAKVNILVATDVAARGLDIDNVSHVINYDMPQTQEDYIHRIGRTGRGEKKGIALTFVN